jgi:protein-glutamine gamma-glutamyltransferase
VSPIRSAAVRLAAVGAFAMFGAQAWAGMVRPDEDGRLIGAGLVGVALAALALALDGARVPRRLRFGLAGVALRSGLLAVCIPVAACLAALLLAGVPLHLLDLESWGELGSGLSQGVQSLPGLNVPYRGVDEWNRIAMLLGGTLTAIVGAALACWPGLGPRTRGLGVLLLIVLYAVPAVQLDLDQPWVEGFVFALLLGGVMWGERLAAREAPLAVGIVVVAAMLALAVAPQLDGSDPWFDYESLAQSLGERGTTSFSWDHSYGPLDWPRDGREVLRVRARTGSYWKATSLTDFDGKRWRDAPPRSFEQDDPAADMPDPRWIQDLRVSVRNLRTRHFVTAGTTLRISRSPRDVVDGAPGSFVTSGRPLRRGHAYLARVYVPRPPVRELASAGTSYPASLWPYLSMHLPQSVGGPPAIDPETLVPRPDAPPAYVVFGEFGDRRPALGFAGRGYAERTGTQWLRESAYARTYALAQRLLARADTPYEYVRAVQGHLSRGFSYSEAPPVRPLPLDAFLFRDRIGYCQQFSGAMALLLRMGGVPARVASGFSPGTRDRDRGEYVVRDLDAHSWVEAYFPGYGWIPFDPTPAVAPARSQLPALDAPAEAAEEETGTGSRARDAERTQDPGALGRGQADLGEGTSLWSIVPRVLLGGLVLALLLYAVQAVRWRRRYGPEAAVAELARALRRTGRAERPGATLVQVEDLVRWSPGAAAYVATVRATRFGYGSRTPTRGQRRALRRELASGLGLRGRLRALVALPPF